MRLPPPFNRRFGRFRIGLDVISEYPERVSELLARCVVVRADVRFERDAIEYTALCPAFSEVAPACEAPIYAVVSRHSATNGQIRCRQPWEFRMLSIDTQLEAWEHIVG